MGQIPPPLPIEARSNYSSGRLAISEDAKRRFRQNADFWAVPDSSRQPGGPEWRGEEPTLFTDKALTGLGWAWLAIGVFGVLFTVFVILLTR